MPVGPCGIRIRHHDFGRNRLAGRELYAARRPVLHHDLANLLSASDRAALPFDQLHHAIDQPSGAAQCEVHAPAPLQERDQAIDRARGKGIAADQQRMEAEDDAQPGIAEEFRNQAVDAAIARQPDHFRRDPRHVGPFAEGNVAELLEADLEDRLAGVHVAVVAGDIVRRKPRDLARAWRRRRRHSRSAIRPGSESDRTATPAPASHRRTACVPHSFHNSSNRNGAVTMVGPASKVKPSCR